MYGATHRQFGLFDTGKKAVKSATQASKRADAALVEAQGAIRQGRQTLTTVHRTAEDMEAYIQRIQNIPIEELARRFDYKTKIAVEELLSLSSFMKKSLLYLAGMATLSIYLNILTKK
jgi:uncharacterized protein YfaQ (DUF2300 family)